MWSQHGSISSSCFSLKKNLWNIRWGDFMKSVRWERRNAKCTTDIIGMRACHESQSGYMTLFERLDKIDRLVPCVRHLSDRWNRLVTEIESTIIITWWSYDLQWWHDHDDGKLKSLRLNLKNTNQEICSQILEVGHLVERLDDVPEAWDFFGYSLNKA